MIAMMRLSQDVDAHYWNGNASAARSHVDYFAVLGPCREPFARHLRIRTGRRLGQADLHSGERHAGLENGPHGVGGMAAHLGEREEPARNRLDATRRWPKGM